VRHEATIFKNEPLLFQLVGNFLTH